jgi:PST family polysaccharide transporter
LFYGILAGAFTRVVLSFILTDQRPSLHFSYSKFRELLAYGKWIFRGRIFTFLGLQLDSIIVSTFLGLYALGIYQMAFRIGSLPINQVTNVMGRIVFPAFSQAQDDRGKVKEYFLTINNVLLVGIAPLVIMIFCLIPEFTAVFLGEKWLGIVPIVRILILSGYARIFVSILDYLFCAIGEPKLAAKMQFNRFVAFGIAIAPLAYFWNITGVALSGLLALLVVWVIYLRKACLMLDIRSSDLRSVYYYPLLFNFIMAVVLYFLKTVIPADDFLRFCMQSSLLCIVYAGVVFLLGRYTSLNFFGRAISIVKSYKLRT